MKMARAILFARRSECLIDVRKSPLRRAFSFPEEPLLGSGDGLRIAENDDDVAFHQSGFGGRLDRADAAAANRADLAAQLLEIQLVERHADGCRASVQPYRVQAGLGFLVVVTV